VAALETRAAGLKRGRGRPPKSPKWRYTVVATSKVAELDKLGFEGWELVAVDSGLMWLRRPMGAVA
jgi:hypothetical protein